MSSLRAGFLRPLTRRRVGGYLSLARISNSPTVFSNVLAGAVLAGAVPSDWRLLPLALALILYYTAGMFLNDLCDYSIDLRERPERPLPSGIVSRREAAVAVLALFATGSALLLYLGWKPFLSGLALVFVIVLYDIWHKSNPLSPLVMAAARALVYVTAFLVFAPGFTGGLIFASGLLALYVVGLTYVARSETGPSVVRHWPAAALFLPVALFVPGEVSVWTLVVSGLFVGWIVYSISFVYRTKGRSVGGAVGRLIAGISLYDGLVLAAAGSMSGLVLALGAFGATLFLQRYIKGT